MDDSDAELARIVRKEAVSRVDRMLEALEGGPGAPAWDEIYRQAHTLAGFGMELRPEVAVLAKRVVGRLRDDYGRRIPLTPAEETALREEVARLSRLVREQAEGP